MSSLIEVVFESIPKKNAAKALIMLINDSRKIISTQCSETIELANNEFYLSKINSILDFKSDLSISINLSEISIGDIIIPNVLLRLVKYNDQYDIDFNFDIKEVDNKNFIEKLHHHIIEIAKNYNIAIFFCGLEPASDAGTRYFTNSNLGPLSS